MANENLSKQIEVLEAQKLVNQKNYELSVIQIDEQIVQIRSQFK